MVLSRMVLNLGDPGARRDLADAYEMHATLMKLVDAGSSKPLWRLERGRGTEAPVVLLQTAEEPDSRALKRADNDYFLSFESRPHRLATAVRTGDTLRFRVRANATVKRAGRRHGLVRDEELTDWITRQITNHGAELLGVVPSETQHEILGRRRSGPRIRLTGTTFDGAFRAGEAEGINRLLRDGIGHARAFGFGLVTIGR